MEKERLKVQDQEGKTEWDVLAEAGGHDGIHRGIRRRNISYFIII